MAVRRVVYYPNDPLTKRAAPIESFDAKLKKLVADLFETMQAYQGVGLAAPQVGISRRLFVLQEPEGEPMALANSEIVELEGEELGEEGCLSIPQVYAMVPRATRIRVKAQDLEGNPLDFEARDFLARIIQHEHDHVEGVLFPDRLDIITRQAKLDEWESIRAHMAAQRGLVPR